MSSYDQTISDTTLYALQPLGVMSKPQKMYFSNQTVNDRAVCCPLSKMIWSLSLDRLFHHGSFLFTSLQGLVNLLLCVNNAESSSHTSVLVNVTFVSPVLTIGLSLVRHILQFDPQALQTHDFWHIKILTLNEFPFWPGVILII